MASLEFPRETGLILRFAEKVGNPLQTKQGNRPTGRDQKGRRGSDEVVPGTSVVPSSVVPVCYTAGLIQDTDYPSLCMHACMHAKSLQLCPTLFDPIEGSPPDSSVPGILQARTLEWVAISLSNA